MRTPVKLARVGRGRRRRFGFTLVELLVSIGIIALLVSLIMPSFGRIREGGRRAVCSSNLKSLGQGWTAYWPLYQYRPPPLHDVSPDTRYDCSSQFNYAIWTILGGTYCNAGVLYATKHISNEQVYVCPTRVLKGDGDWFGSDGHLYRDAIRWHDSVANPWPAEDGNFTFMTYGTRRMGYYDDPNMKCESPWVDPIMLRLCGVGGIARPSSFSYMADSFCTPDVADRSHVPGVNVQYLDGSVRFFQDSKGDVLYRNGIAAVDNSYNFPHDKIWMIIDGKFAP